MNLRTAKCPNCGGELQIASEIKTVICMYCDSQIMVQEAIENRIEAMSGSITTWLELARSAASGGNSDEAIEYYNKILEVDENNVEAWLAKGEHIWAKSTLAHPRITDAISYLSKAINKSNNNSEIIKKASEIFYNQITSLAKQSQQHQEEFHEVESSTHQLGRIGFKILESCSITIKNGFDKIIISKAAVYSWDTTYLFWGDTEGKLIIPYLINILEKEPDYTIKLVEGSKKVLNKNLPEKYSSFKTSCTRVKGGCFIATATMGDINHPIVIELRDFRDNWLAKREWGRFFIQNYYKFSPRIAQVINFYPVLRLISLYLIIMPLHYLTSKVLRNSKREGSLTTRRTE